MAPQFGPADDTGLTASATVGRIWLAATLLPFLGGYFLSYLIRNSNATISGRLVEQFGLGARELGVLTSLYFLSSALAQIPAGLLIDRFGPRRVQVAMLLVGAMGAAGFGLAQDALTLMISRALIGLGTSTALVAGFKAITLWLPVERRVAARSCLVASGGLGAVAATIPAEYAAEAFGWRIPFLALAAMLAILALVMLRLPEPGGSRTATWRGICGGLRVVVRDARFWRVVPLSATLIGGVFAIQGLWAARWLTDVRGLSSGQAAPVLFCMACGLTVGAPIFGALGRLAQRRGISMRRVFGAAALALITVEGVIMAGAPVPPWLLLGAFASFGALTVLGFSLIDGLFPPDLGGRANAAYNVVQLGTTFAVQAGFGVVVAGWPTGMDGQVTSAAYSAAIGCVIAAQAVAFVWFVRPDARRRVTSYPQRDGDGEMIDDPQLSRHRPLSTKFDLAGEERRGVRQALVVGLIGLAVLVLVGVLQPTQPVLVADAPLEAVLFVGELSDR